MSRYDDLKKKRSSKTQEQKEPISTSRYQSIKANRGERNYSVDDNFINTFIQDAQSFFATSQEESKNLTWQSGTDNARIQSRNDTVADLGSRSAAIRAYLNANRSKLDESTYSELTSVLDQIDSGRKDVFHSFRNAENTFSKFDSEEAYNDAVKQWESDEDYQTSLRQEGYKQKYSGMSWEDIQTTLDKLEDGEEKEWLSAYQYDLIPMAEDFDSRSTEGWEKYIAARETKKQSQQEARENESFWEKLGRWLGPTGATDTSIPLGNAPEITHNLAADTSYQNPSDDWTEEQKAVYGYLYNPSTSNNGRTDVTAAAKYAALTNETNAQAENAKKIASIEKWATQNGWTMAASTVAAIATMPLSIADTLSALTEYNARGFVSTSAAPLPGQVSNAITGAISATLNGVDEEGVAKNVLSENIPVIGGKGMGDVYQLGTSIANSMLSAYTQGPLGTYLVFFGSASSQGIYDAKNRGATDGQAITLGILNGLAEAAGEAFSVEKLLSLAGVKEVKKFFFNLLLQAGIEASEEGVTTLLNNFSDQLVMSDKSNFNILVNYYMTEKGLSEGDAKKTAWKSMANDLAFDMVGGFISGGVSSGLQTGVQTMFVNRTENKQALQKYGPYSRELVEEALEINPDNAFAQKMQGRLDEGNNLSGSQLNRLVQQNEAALTVQDKSAIQSAAAERLTELGETGDVTAIAAALAKRFSGEKLTNKEYKLIQNSKYGRRVSTEMNPANIRSGGYASAWAENIGTERINVEEYSRLVEAAQLPQETAQVTEGQVAAPTPNVAQVVQPDAVDTSATTIPANDQQVTGKLTGKESLQVAEESSATEETAAKTATLEKASEKYGAQAQAMVSTYTAGQDVGKFDDAYRLAYNWGQSGVSRSYVNRFMDENAELGKNDGIVANVLRYLTKEQVQLAYEVGQASSITTAKEKDAENKYAANGKTGRREGVVRVDGVTVKNLNELRAILNDTQKLAYKYLSDVTKVTGIDIVLYRSEAGKDGKFRDAYGKIAPQGKYRPSEPYTIYIDLNAGLRNVDDVNKLHRYAMLRTFAHEFTHFIENWNPIQYNELRKAVFEAQESRGVDVHARILEKQKNGLTYEQASREAVAESMTDILPDSNFVQELAEKHRNIFQWLLDKLKEFVNNLKDYYKTIGGSYYEGATALKEQVGDTVKYLDSIVQLFDKVAVQAVENAQATVATEEVAVAENETTTTETKTVSKLDENQVKPSDPITYDGKNVGVDDFDPSLSDLDIAEDGSIILKPRSSIGKGVGVDDFVPSLSDLDIGKDGSIILKPRSSTGKHIAPVTKADAPTERRYSQNAVPAQQDTATEEATPVVEETTPAVEENQEIPFDKRTLSLLKSTGRVGAVDFEGQKYVTNGYIMLPTTSAGFKYAHVELNATTMNAEVVKNTFENAKTLVTKAPMEGKAGTDDVYIFDVGGKKLYFKKKLFSHIDGGLLYASPYNGGSVIKSVNEDGGIRGYLLGMKIKDESSITDLKPAKIKSFSKKMQALIDAQTAPAPKPVESVIEHRTQDGVGEWPDIYERLKNPLHGMNVFITGGYVFKVRLTPGAGYVGSIKQHSEEYISSARGLEYTSAVFPNRNDAIQDIVTVARNNRLLETAASADTVTKPTENVTKTPDAVTEPVESGTNTASEKLAAKLLESYLTEENINRGGKALTSKALYALADEAFGGTQAEGTYNRKDAYDAMELAVNKFLLQQAAKAHRTFNGSAQSAVTAVEFMQDMLELLPTQNVRTQEMEDFQQFSTPPNIAYLAAWAAKISSKDMVLEPSAGIGGLAVFAKAWGAEVAVNELSKRRLEVLRAMGFDHLFNENAEQIDNILPDSISPSVVIMNPPFSSTAGRTANNKTSNAEKHIDQALARLRDGGRLVAVLGKSMNDQDYYRYWDKLRKKFNIRANLSIDGSNYKKYGTTWGVQIVVIDKTGPQTGETVTGRFTDLTEVPKVLEGIRNDRRSLEENRPASGNDSIREPVSNGGNGQPDTGHQGSGERPVGSSADTQRKKTRKGTDTDPGTGNRADGKTVAETGSEKTERQDGGAARTAGRTDIGDGNGTAEPSGVNRHQSKQPLQQLTEQDNVSDDGVYATFVAPDIPVKGGEKHPAVLVESAAMAAVAMPKATYKPSLPENVIKNNLSDAQLVAVTYAGQAHEQKLPDGRRKGFFIGDGTGVGKGRQIAGIILDNFMQGRTKAVWISKNNDLYVDTIRDWTATTGRSKDEVVSHSKIKPKDKISLQEGILYSSYDTIKSEKGGNRLDQIVEWVGEDFDGVIAFDEAHNMGNLFGKKGKFGKSKGSEKARAGVELQRRLPNARIVYVSATAATEVDNLAYAERIGLWGQGTAFSTAQDFISKIGASGLAAMELVIRDMKAMGTYVARSISYNGVNYDTVEHGLDPMQTEIYNTMSRAWQKTMSNVQSALETTGGQYNSTERQKALGNFYSAMQRFYNQVLTSMSMPSVIADMRKELAAGHSCVLQIVNTNEAQQNKQLAEAKANGESLDNLDLTPREALVGYLANSFPTQMFEEYTDEDGNLRSRPVMDSAGNPVQNREAIRQRDALIEEVNQMSIPDGPLEMLFDAFGPDAVAENTGRSRRVVPRKQADGTISRVEERRTLNHRTADVQAFQDGKKRILVFSDAGGTGKSYHADRTEKNQQLRIHYVLQPGWVASNAVQGFGRTHRSNEASAPIYKLVTTNIKGQKRFTSTIARRLDQLGALTKGQRDTGSGMFGAKDNLETDLAKDSLREFYKRLGKNQIEGIDGMKTLDRLGLKQKFTDEYGAFKLNDNLARDIGTFLNRILALEVDEQNVVFDAFISIYEMELEAAIQSGTLDTGMENVKADRVEVVDDKVIRQDKNTGASTHYIQAKTYTKPKVVTTVAEMQQRRTGFEGIYRTETGVVKAVFRIADKTTEWGAIQKQYRLVGPNQGAKTNVWGEATLKEKAQPIDKADWQKEWDAEVARVPQYNEDTMHMLTGALLPIWNSLPQEGNTKVKRLIAHDGSTYLGRVIDKDLIDGVLKGFDIGRTMEVFTAKQVMDKALDSGTHFYLTNDRVQIFRSRVSGEWRLEIVQPHNSWYLTKRYPGIIQERISYRDRYFIPVGEKGIPILEKLLADNPVRNTAEDDVQYQSRDYLEENATNKYSYEWFVAKPDMEITIVDDSGSYRNNQARKNVANLAVENAKNVGTVDAFGNAVVHVADNGSDVVISKSGIKHSLDRRADIVGPVAEKAGEILKNAIQINELNPRESNIKNSYILMGVAKNKKNEPYIVSFVVNRYTHELVEMEVVYSMNAKTEPAGSLSPRITTQNAGSFTGSKITIAEYLDFVNEFFADVMPEAVLKHYGYDARPDGILGEDVLYQQRTNTLTDRDVFMLAYSELDTGDWTDGEKDALGILGKHLSKLETLQEERAEQGRLYREQQFGPNVDRKAAAETLNRMRVLDSQIQKASADVLDIENKEVLRRVLKKARSVIEQQDRQHFQEIMRRKIDRMHNAAAIKKYRDRLRGDVDELTNWVLHPDNKNVVKHIPDALKNTVLPFLNSINFMSKRSLAGGNHTQADKAFMEQSRRLAKVMEKTVDLDEMYSNYTDLPPDFMKKLRSFIDTAQEIVDENSGDFIINQMTAEDLKNLSHVVRTLKKYIMEMNRFHVNQMFKHVPDAGENSIDFMVQMKPAENTGAVSQFLLWQQMRPAYAFERFGDGGMAIYDGLRRGQATLAFNTKKIMEFSEKAYTTAEVKAWENEVKTIRIGPEKTVTMRVSQIMSLYELSKRKQAEGHILVEGIRVATFKNGKKKISDVGQTLTPGELNLILRELTPRQKEVADKLQQFMEKQGGEWGNYVTVARFGEKQFGEENYFPINSDGRHLSVDADEKPGAAALYALLNMGFTKQTQEKAKNRIIVYSIFDVFSNHMASMAQYNAFALPVVDALKWFNYQRVAVEDDGSKTILGSVREQMDRAFGVPEENRPGSGRRGYAQNFVINIIKALNGTEAQGTAYDSWGMKWLHTYNRAQVAYNFRVVVQQPLAITRAAQLLDYASILRGMKIKPAAIRKNILEMQKYSGIAAWKSLGFYDVNISRGLTSIIKHDDTWVDKVTDVGMWGAEKADTLTWAAIWSAAKEEVIRKKKLTPKSEGFYDAVAKLFEDVIYKTQVVDSVLTKNEFMRDKGFFARSIGSFMSEPTTTASMLVDAYDKYHMDLQRGMNRQQAWKKNGKNIVRTAYVFGLGAVILAAVQAVSDAFRDDDDYEEWNEKWLEAFGGNLVDELMPFNKLPIVSDFYDLAKELLSVVGVDTYGNPPQSVFMQWYDSLVKGVEILYDKISGADTNYTWYGGAYKLLQAISGMTGLPMAGATREIVTAWNNIVGAMAPSLKVKTYDPGEMNEIKYAYQDGYLTAEEASEELLAQGLVDTEDEAYFTVQGWEAGEGYSRYDTIFDAVRNGGDFNTAMNELTSHGYTEKDVLSQVKSKIGEWYKGGEITKQQATNMLTKYFDMDSEEITTTVNKWSSKVVTGIAYENIKAEYLAGNITATRAVEMRMRYGGETREDAKNTVGEWAFEAEHPELDGLITYTQYKRWETDGKPNGVSLDTFANVAEFRNDGTSDSVKSQEDVAAYINALNISTAQKDALWCCFWKKSTLKNAPWH